MEVFQAILLGIIEGLTEFLPISSTGHLIVSAEYMSFKDTAEVFTVVIQLGAMAAVVWNYREDLSNKTVGLFKGNDSSKKFWLNLLIATTPAVALALALSSYLDEIATAGVVAVALILGAFVLWWADSIKPKAGQTPTRSIAKITSKQALIIGIAQCLSLIPGTSRSGSTIVGGLIGGLDRVTATAFSFYLGVPVLALAGAYKLIFQGDEIANVSGGWLSIIVGTIVAFITALIAIRWLLKYVSTHSFAVFVWYRLILGILIIILLV